MNIVTQATVNFTFAKVTSKLKPAKSRGTVAAFRDEPVQSMSRSVFARRMVVLSVAALLPLGLSGQSADGQRGLVRDGITVKISEHVYVIPDQNMGLVPNIGIVVGSRATLVVDTGLGPVNAQTVLREVAKVSQGSGLYIVSTHYHPEHAAGEMSFPDGARVIRARGQQQDIDELGTDSLVRFRGISPLIEELLVGVDYRDADTIFDREHELDLGGVRVRIMALGPTHTRGDTMVFVEEDGVLLAGDVVMNQRFVVVDQQSLQCRRLARRPRRAHTA